MAAGNGRSRNKMDKIGSWSSRILRYLLNHPNVKANNHSLHFQYDIYKKDGIEKIGLNELIHIDPEDKTVMMHSPFWPLDKVIRQLIRDSARKYHVPYKVISCEGEPDEHGILEIKVNKFFPGKIQNLFNTLTAVYEFTKRTKG